MKNLIFGIIVFNISLCAYGADNKKPKTDISNLPSGYYSDIDYIDGKMSLRFNAEPRNKRQFELDSLVATKDIITKFCASEKFNHKEQSNDPLQSYVFFPQDEFFKAQLKNEKVLCEQLKSMPWGSLKDNRAIISKYKKYICPTIFDNGKSTNGFAPQGMYGGDVEDSLNNCLSDAKELTFLELFKVQQHLLSKINNNPFSNPGLLSGGIIPGLGIEPLFSTNFGFNGGLEANFGEFDEIGKELFEAGPPSSPEVDIKSPAAYEF